jgi:hypothetical protein
LVKFLRSSGCEEIEGLRPSPSSEYRGSFPEKKRPERDDDSSPISEVENEWRYASTPALALHLMCGISFPFFYYDYRKVKFSEIVICEVKCRW